VQGRGSRVRETLTIFRLNIDQPVFFQGPGYFVDRFAFSTLTS
jgi:hypothetical protein